MNVPGEKPARSSRPPTPSLPARLALRPPAFPPGPGYGARRPLSDALRLTASALLTAEERLPAEDDEPRRPTRQDAS
ncbi:hypothetical protein ABZ864_34660 [Streptomyces sp. NPDC047082]|uniref:hypothetical protein n=1 Tax=Streptomyces sp. NPDC047082 TaxID=3155259 RepID=UPI0033E0D8B4